MNAALWSSVASVLMLPMCSPKRQPGKNVMTLRHHPFAALVSVKVKA